MHAQVKDVHYKPLSLLDAVFPLQPLSCGWPPITLPIKTITSAVAAEYIFPLMSKL